MDAETFSAVSGRGAYEHDAPPDFDRRIRQFIWLYFFLLLFEGAVRKWFLPSSLSPAMAVIRDPVLMYIYWMAFRSGKLPSSPFVISCGVLAVLSFLAGLMPDRNTLFVDLYGVRTNFLHMPFIFLVPKFFSAKDVVRMGKWCLIIMIPVSFLMVDQFMSSPDAWINKASSEEASQISGGVGKVRPPGIFTFATGAAEFSALCAVFLIYGTMFRNTYPKALLVGSGIALAAGMSSSISRLNISSVGVVVLCLFLFNCMRPGFVPRFIPFFVLGVIAFLVLVQLPSIRQGLDAFSDRINDASASEGGHLGFIHRVTTVFTDAYSERLWEGPVEGAGLGMGTNAGSRLLVGKDSYLLSEGEWQRITLESGPILGSFYLLWRVMLLAWIGRRALGFAYRAQPLPLLLFGACLPLILIGQLGRPTTLGFTVLDAALCVAAMNSPEAIRSRPVVAAGRRVFRRRPAELREAPSL